MYVLWARRGVGGGARTLAPRSGGCVFAWALGAPPAARVAWVTPLRGASEAGRSPSSGCPPPGGCRGSPPTCCGRGCAGVGVQHCPLGLLVLWGPRAAGVAGGGPWGGCPATVVRGVRCQALSLPWPLVLWGGQPGFRDPCVPGACGPSTGPTACTLVGRRCALWGWRESVPRGVALRRCEGRLRSGAPPLRLPALSAGSRGSAARVYRVRLVRAWGPGTGPTVCALAGRCCALWGWRRGVPGGVPFAVVRGV